MGTEPENFKELSSRLNQGHFGKAAELLLATDTEELVLLGRSAIQQLLEHPRLESVSDENRNKRAITEQLRMAIKQITENEEQEAKKRNITRLQNAIERNNAAKRQYKRTANYHTALSRIKDKQDPKEIGAKKRAQKVFFGITDNSERNRIVKELRKNNRVNTFMRAESPMDAVLTLCPDATPANIAVKLRELADEIKNAVDALMPELQSPPGKPEQQAQGQTPDTAPATPEAKADSHVFAVADYLDAHPDQQDLFDKMTRLKNEQPTHPVALQINNRWQIISANIKRTPQDAKKLTDGFFTWLEGKKQAIEEALQPQTAPKTTAPVIPPPIPSAALGPMPSLPQKYAPQSRTEPPPPPIPARPTPQPTPTPPAPTVDVRQEDEVLFKLPQEPLSNELASSMTELRRMNPDANPDGIYIEDADIPITPPLNSSATPAPTTPPPDSDVEAIPDPLSETQRVADTDIVEEEPDTSTDDAETIVNSADVEREGLINPMLAKFLPANLVNKKNPECWAIYNLILKEKLDVADLTRFIGNPEEYMKLSATVDPVKAREIDKKIADKNNLIKSYTDAKRDVEERLKKKKGEIQAILDARGAKGLDLSQQENLTTLRGEEAELEKEMKTAEALEKCGSSRRNYKSPRAVLELVHYYWKRQTDKSVNMESLTSEVDERVETERKAIDGRDKPLSGWGLFRPSLGATLKAIAAQDKAFAKIGDKPAEKLAELAYVWGASEGDVTKWLESLPDGVDKKTVTIRLIAYLESAVRNRQLNSIMAMSRARKLAGHLRAARNSMIRDEVAKEGGDANAKMMLYIEKLNQADYEASRITKSIIESTSKWAVGSRIAAGTALTIGGAAAALASLPALPIIMTALTAAGITKVITTGFNENIPEDRRGKIIKRNGVGALMTSLGAVGTLALGPWGLLASAIPGAIWGVKKYRDWRKKGKKK